MALAWMPKESRVVHPATILCSVCEVLKARQHRCPPGWLLGWWGASVEMPASVPEIWKISTSLSIWLPFVREMLKLARGLLLVDHVSLKKKWSDLLLLQGGFPCSLSCKNRLSQLNSWWGLFPSVHVSQQWWCDGEGVITGRTSWLWSCLIGNIQELLHSCV